MRELVASGEPVREELAADLGVGEGRPVEAHVRQRERDLQTRKLDAVACAGHSWACEVYVFDFDASYGAAHSGGYMEVHHVVTLHLSGEKPR